jgi:hypothetical protein
MKNLCKPTNFDYSNNEDDDKCLMDDAFDDYSDHLPLAFSGKKLFSSVFNRHILNQFSNENKESIAEFMQKLLDEKFLVDDLSFIFEISQKRTLSPCTILLAMIYLKRLKQNSSKCVYSFTNCELCLVSLVSLDTQF